MRSRIEEQVMGRVAVMYATRKLLSRTAVELYALGISLIGLAALVSLPHILSNLTHVGIAGAGAFVLVALIKTAAIVRFALFVAVVALAFLLIDAIRIIRPTPSLA